MMDVYDKQGKPISMNSPLLIDREYKRIAETTLPNGVWVSTVWLGYDHQLFDGGPPLIFETMVFSSPSDLVELDLVRYSIEEEARLGHDAVVAAWKSRGGKR